MARLTHSGLWAEPVGKSILAFGGIEHVVVVALREIPTDRIQKSAIRMQLAAKVDLLLEILEGYAGAEYIELATALKDVKELAKTRNIIAHNPLVLEFYEIDEGNFLTNEVIAVIHKEGHKLSLTDLNDFVGKAEALLDRLHGCVAAVRGARLRDRN